MSGELPTHKDNVVTKPGGISWTIKVEKKTPTKKKAREKENREPRSDKKRHDSERLPSRM